MRKKSGNVKKERKLDRHPQAASLTQDTQAGGENTNPKNDLPICTDVEELPSNLRTLVDRMLREGATYEDTVDVVGAAGQQKILQGAVEVYFRSNLKLQRERVQKMAQTTENLRQSLRDPNSAHAQFAEAVLMTGLMGLRRSTASAELHHAVQERQQLENYRLKEASLRLKEKKAVMELQMMRTRLQSERDKITLVKAKLEQLQRTLQRDQASSTLSPEMIQRIQEVYGIVSDEDTVNSTGPQWEN
jgi:hypothetical protein